MPQLILIVPLIAAYLDVARPFKKPPVMVLDMRCQLTAYQPFTMQLIADLDKGGK